MPDNASVDPFGVPVADDFHCGRCGTLLDGGTDEPVVARELRAEIERLRRIIADLIEGETEAERARLYALAAIVLDYLDGVREETGVDEWDESDPRCDVYNAATAVVERDRQDGDEHMDRELFRQLGYIEVERRAR